MAEATNRAGARRASRSVRLSAKERRQLATQQAGRRALSPDEVKARRREGDFTPVAGGARALRPPRRRTRGLLGTLGLTFAGALIPGTGYLYAGRKAIGWIVFVAWLAIAGGVAWHFGRDWRRGLDLLLDPKLLTIAVAVVAGLLLIWLFVVWTSYRMIRPPQRPRWHTVVGNLAVIVFCAVIAAPVLRAGQYALATAGAVRTVFEDNETATTPDDVTEDNPWGGRDRVNVLLLGGDGGDGRDGVRTDTVILLSMNTETGKAISFSLPRNMANARFPEGSPLAEEYPEGFGNGDPASGDFMLNAIYRNIPAWYPGILGKSKNEGADAIKQAVEGTLGIPVHYYVLVNLAGFRDIIDAMGGVTVNINEPVAVQGDTTAGIPPDEWLAPGENVHLDGYYALWFARGRYGSDDYERMERQRCMIDAVVKEADPQTLFVHYLELVEAGQELVYTDIPQELASAFVELALRVKDNKMKSVAFISGDKWSSAAPDIDYMQDVVARAIDPPPRKPGGGKDTNPAKDAENACAYNPTGEQVAEGAVVADVSGTD